MCIFIGADLGVDHSLWFAPVLLSPVALMSEIERSFNRATRVARAALEEEADVLVGDLFDEEVQMANQNQRITLESLTAPDLEQQTRAVAFPTLADGQRF